MMNRRLRLLALFLLFFSTSPDPKPIQAEPTWETLTPGIDFHEFILQNPFNHVYVARMDRSVETISLETSLGLGKISSGVENVKNQASRYNQSLNNWKWIGATSEPEFWGGRNQVIVAINGGYFDTTGSPLSGQIQSGWYSKRFLNLETFSGVVWKSDRSIFVGGCVTHPADKQVITLKDGTLIEMDDINRSRGTNELILYTAQYDSKTPNASNGIEVLIQMKQPTYLTTQANDTKGVIKKIRQNVGSTPILFDHVVVSAHGTKASDLLEKIQVGDEIGFAQKVKDNDDLCQAPSGVSWDGAYSAIQNDYHFLQKGTIIGYPANAGAIVRAPRTAITFNDQYIYFIVVDGRNPGISYGMTIEELGRFALNELGAVEGAAMDGGGSSTMVVNGSVVNFPSDGVHTPCSNKNPCSIKNLYIPYVQGCVATPQPAPAIPLTLRSVANGWMMVAVEEPEFSTVYLPGNSVKTNGNTNLRQGPGTNYLILDSISSGTNGTVLNNSNNLNGVKATGYFWWNIQFGDQTGWVAESLLTKNP